MASSSVVQEKIAAWVGGPALIVALVATILFAMDLVPGWGGLDLGWPKLQYYVVAGALGALAGVAIAPYRVAGLVGGGVAAAGSLLTVVGMLGLVHAIPKIALAIAAAIGLVPGIIVYAIGHSISARLSKRVRARG